MDGIDFQGRVAIVTGAGPGLGREHVDNAKAAVAVITETGGMAVASSFSIMDDERIY